ncbi:MAG: type II secretion system protein [Planctomycetota bacterium]
MLRNTQRQAFTLIELLVTLTIIAVVLGIALPTFSHVRTTARESRDIGHTRQTGVALLAHATDHRGRLPGLERLTSSTKNPGIKTGGRDATWVDVLLNKGYADSPLMFADSTVDTSGDYGNSVGLIRYHFSKYTRNCNTSVDNPADYAPPAQTAGPYSPYTWQGRGVRNCMGPDIQSIANHSDKFMAAESLEGEAWAYLSDDSGPAHIRHSNYTGHYAFFDGSAGALSFQDVFGVPYNENATPIGPRKGSGRDIANNWIDNLRHLGMVGKHRNTAFGTNYTSAEFFPAWAPWMN